MNLAPYRSIAGGYWGALALIIVWMIHTLGKIEVPVEIGMAIGVVVQGLGTHFMKDRPEIESLPLKPGEK